MDEFTNRMTAQRHILAIINESFQATEELCGLSESAISRWVEVNRIEPFSEVVRLLRRAADLLFFLATKSQEQVTEEYEARIHEVALVTAALRLSDIYAMQRSREGAGD
jgi:hypothetical protein